MRAKPSLIITVGLPASGKTRWARQQLQTARREERRGSLWRSNRDDLRRMMLDTDYRTMEGPLEDQITCAQFAQMSTLLDHGQSVICDDTNLRMEFLALLIELARMEAAALCVCDFTRVPLAICIDRDLYRLAWQGHVGRAVITEMHDKFIAPYAGDQHPCVAMILEAGGTLLERVTA
jgi:predicted kinase